MENFSPIEYEQSQLPVTIYSDRPGDAIYVNEEWLGVSPVTTKLLSGTYRVVAKRDNGKQSGQMMITVQKGGKNTIYLEIDNGLRERIRWGESVNVSQREILTRLVGNMMEIEESSFWGTYYIGRYEVTQEEWQAVMGANPAGNKGNRLPVEQVSWNDCLEFVRKLNQMTGMMFKIPTETQWEYAARGGERYLYYTYAGSDDVDDVAWYSYNSGRKSHIVGEKSMNGWGLFDMSGNVEEWCTDWYKEEYVFGSKLTGPEIGTSRVVRGGGWNTNSEKCRVSTRAERSPDEQENSLGLRLAFEDRVTYGKLSVSSANGEKAEVYVDDVKKGTTPFCLEQLKSGEHRICVQLPNHYTYDTVVYVLEGQLIQCEATIQAICGTLDIQTTPDNAIARVNGKDYGLTPCVIEKLPVGEYEVEIVKEGYVTEKRTVVVEENKTSPLDVELLLICGTLDIRTTPEDAIVMMNGENYGVTPCVIENLPIGEYEVEITKDGYFPEKRIVIVDENKVIPLDVELFLICGTLDIRTTPDNAIVRVNGKDYGLTPCVIERLLEGEYEVEIAKDGYVTEKRTVVVKKNSTATVNITLEEGSLVDRIKWASSATSSQKTILTRLVSNMVLVKKGMFAMGATSEQGSDYYANERPVHQVTLTQDYYIGKYEVIQAEWQAVLGNNPSFFVKGDNYPVESVSWEDCQDFINKLNILTGLAFRLPTEAEWEYAARGGDKSKGYKYSGSNTIGDVAWSWYSSNSNFTTHPVGTKQSNELGIYDMSGNVWEWCSDRYGFYSGTSQTNPVGPESGSRRVNRGGSWNNDARGCRVSNRDYYGPSSRNNFLGFRVALLP